MDNLINKYLGNDIPVKERLFFLAMFSSSVASLIFMSVSALFNLGIKVILMYGAVALIGATLFFLNKIFHNYSVLSVIFLVTTNLILFPYVMYYQEHMVVEVPLYMFIGITYGLVLLDGIIRIIIVGLELLFDLFVTFYCYVLKDYGEIPQGAVQSSEFIRLELSVVAAGVLCGIVLSYRNKMLQHEISVREIATQKAEQVSYAKDMFLVNVSHEIRTPLNAIIGTTEILLDSDANNHVKEMAFNISNSSHALLSITTDLLDFSRMNIDTLEPEQERFDFSLMLNDIINLMSVRLLDSDVEFFVNVNPEIPRILVGDSGKIRQIIINLLSNAIKYTPSGHMTFNADFKNEQGRIHLFISVEDTGIGIKEESIEKIFEPYNRSGEDTDRVIEGNGLGLALCKKLASIMGGSLRAESKYGEGSTFYFEVTEGCTGQETVGGIKDKRNVLLFCDKSLDADVFAEIAAKMNLGVIRAERSDEFLELLQDPSLSFYFIDSKAYDHYKNDIKEFISDWHKLVVISSCNYSYAGEPFEFVLTKPLSCLNISDIINNTKNFLVRRQSYEGEIILPDVKMLIVDDNLINLSVAKGMLEKYKAEIITASSGKEALNILSIDTPDIIFLDYMMPEMDGIDTLKAIRDLPDPKFKTVPVICLTANVVSGAKEMFINAGFDDYLTKPIESAKLKKMLIDHLSDRKIKYSVE